MGQHALPIPDEPRTLLAEIRAYLDQSPVDGLHRIESADWMVDVLWPVWCERLEQGGIDRDQLRKIVAGYRNELRLWVMGERPWSHCIEGLIGRVERRMKVSST